MPSAGVEVVCAPAEEETDEVAADPRRYCRGCQRFSAMNSKNLGLLTRHQLRLNGREAQAIHNLRRKERQGSQRHAVEDVSQVMRHHSGAEHGLHDLFSRGMLVRVASALDLDARLDEFLVIFGQEHCSRWVVGEVEERQESAEDSDQALDDELEVGKSISTFRQQPTRTRSVRTKTCSLTNQRNPSNPAAPFM